MGRGKVANARWERSEFETAGAATLNLREAKVMRTRGTDNRLVFTERRERVGVW